MAAEFPWGCRDSMAKLMPQGVLGIGGAERQILRLLAHETYALAEKVSLLCEKGCLICRGNNRLKRTYI